MQIAVSSYVDRSGRTHTSHGTSLVLKQCRRSDSRMTPKTVLDVRYGNDMLCVAIGVDNMSSFGCTPVAQLNGDKEKRKPPVLSLASPHLALWRSKRHVAHLVCKRRDAVVDRRTGAFRCRRSRRRRLRRQHLVAALSLLALWFAFLASAYRRHRLSSSLSSLDNAPFVALPSTLATFEPLRSFEDGDMLGARSRSPLVSLWFPFRNVTVTARSQVVVRCTVSALRIVVSLEIDLLYCSR